MIEAVGFSCLSFELLDLNLEAIREIVCDLREELHLQAGSSILESFALLEIFERILSILGCSLVVLQHKREVTEVSKLNLCLIHLEAALEPIILVPLRLLEHVHDAILDAFPRLGDGFLQDPDPLPHERQQARFDDLLHLRLYLLSVLWREDLSPYLPRRRLRHRHLHVNQVSRIQINIVVEPEVLELILVLSSTLRGILHAHGHLEDEVALELLL